MEKILKRNKPTDCQSCIHYVNDDDSLGYYCEKDLDQDERANFSVIPNIRCPFYQFADEYINIRKQI